ncbi:similar to phosducin [Ectocarpus siliculosus]|uniref:Similar to phosducin n=1 Tax=Ectocarpus siliculosus TaxID=2880 RepID=D8LEJ7_ECTSI|nr:similar to phosducin [Ectocarpus siliculosus]|eukprot:CBN80240.1 similar to phosducin [Ectocarpus siliculosus]
MGDLEDKILKKNIPGKYTWWEKDSDEEGETARADWVDREASDPEREMTEMEKQKKWVDNDCPEPIRRTIMARQEKERARTGVKGVLADFDAWKLSADAEDLIAKEYRAAMLKRMTEGHTVPGSLAATTTTTATTGDGSDGSDDDDDDGGFLGSYRRRRLEQLKATAGRPQFGQIVEAERSTFVSAVDTEDPRTSVVVHLYEPYIDACRRMNRFLEVCVLCRFVRGGGGGLKVGESTLSLMAAATLFATCCLASRYLEIYKVLATKQPTVKFLRLRSSAAEGGDYDPVALPTLLLYRAGEVVGCMTRVTDDIGENFTQEDVEWLLQEHDVFEALQNPQVSGAGAGGAGEGVAGGVHGMSTGRRRREDGLADSDDDAGNDS